MFEFNEYKDLLDHLEETLKLRLKPYYRAVYLFGSCERELQQSGWIIPGVSDLDIALIIDTGDLTSYDDGFNPLDEITLVLEEFFLHPIYSTLLDLIIWEYQEFPVTTTGIERDAIMIRAASRGKLLLGKDILSQVTPAERLIKETALNRLYRAYEQFKQAYYRKSLIGNYDLAYLATDSIFEIAWDVLTFYGYDCKYKAEVPDLFLEKFADNKKLANFSQNLFQEAMRYRLGNQKLDTTSFINQTLKFFSLLLNLVRNPI